MAEPQSRVRCPFSVRLAELLFFLALAVASTWPLVSRFDSAIPRGQEKAATVPLFNLWTVWWNADRVSALWSDYWDAPIFAPAENAFALSESQPVTGIVAPAVWLSESRALPYNVYLLLVLTANGWCGSLLIRSWTGSRLAGLWGGAALSLLPFVHWQLGVLQLISLSGILLTLHFLRRFFRDHKLIDAALTGASIGFCYLSCNYYGYQLGLVLLLSWPLLLRRMRQTSRLRQLIVGLILCTVTAGSLIFPIASVQLSKAADNEWDRERDLVARLSATQDDYWRSAWRGPLADGNSEAPRYPLSPGLACLVLAAAGVITGLRHRETRSFTLFLLAFVAVAAQLSLGPGWVLWDERPFEYLAEWLPGLSAVRSPHRFAVLVQIACVGLAGASFVRRSPDVTSPASETSDVARDIPLPEEQFGSGNRWRLLISGTHIGLAVAVLVEVWPARPELYAMPEFQQERPWIEWLQTETAADEPVASLPFPTGRGVSDYQDSAVAMLWGTYHRRPLANGYSGFFPDSFIQLKRDVQGFPDNRSVQALHRAGVRWCVVHLDRLDRPSIRKLSEQPRLELRFAADDGQTRIYEVAAPAD